MRDTLFQYYVDFGHNLAYLRRYSISARRIGNVYTGFLLLASAGGIVTLSCWDELPALWALIVAAAQVLQALKPLTQSEKQRQALKFIIQDASAIFDEIGAYWTVVNAYNPPTESDEAIQTRIFDFKRRARASEDRFKGDIDFPLKPRLDELAKKDNERFFWYYYDVRAKEEL